jgi:imidazolonepropionase-like amidohydrolase
LAGVVLVAIVDLSGEERLLAVEGGRYTALGQAGGPVIDLRDYLSMGGLADCHAHLAADSLADIERPTTLEDMRHRAFAQLAAGVFLVIDKGWRHGMVLQLMSDPPPSRPHLQAAARIITGPDGYFPGFAVETDDQGLSAAVAAADQAGGWVKLIGDWPQKGRGPVISFGEEALAAAVAVAHRGGARVAIHTMAPATPGMAVRAGVDSIEHGLYLTPDDLEELGRRGGAWVPTICNTEDVISGLVPGSSGVRILGEGLANVRRLLPEASAAGVAVLCGTDLGLAHGRVAREAQRLIEYGLRPGEAMEAVGPAAYRYLGIDYLAEGAEADLVVFSRRLEDDPSELSLPLAAMRAGRVLFDPQGLLAPLRPAEP